ncbi:TetR/AcrR family transcriptional regulator [Frankia canadensis]|uniref:TetR/AcrR family transcriptional regulator n=1 Tax=Frankia canadensis TaxID=1836972 RepID=UPI001FAF392D|nr:TetR/AcrR family transcriptional regulator [Frankia canadensis]
MGDPAEHGAATDAPTGQAMGTNPGELSRAERRRARIRASIADAALQLFMSRGYDATTVEDVAAAVDMSPRTVFRYFPFKEDMLREAVHFELAVLVEAMRARPAEEHPADALGRAMVDMWRNLDNDPEVVRSLLLLITELPRVRGVLVEASRTSERALAEVLATRLGRAPTDLSTRVATACALAAINVVVDAWASMPPGSDLVPLVDEAMAALRAGPLRVCSAGA